MKDDFKKNLGRAMIVLLGLLVLDRLPAVTGQIRQLSRLNFVIWEMHNGALNADDYHALAAGYYEGIEHTDQISRGLDRNDYRLRGDFLRYEYKPNVKYPYPAGMRITNSLAMANPEYGVDKPAHTRRIALLGDSISVGPWEHSYEQLLENRLNQSYLTPDIQKYQVVNFSVPGYIVLQKMEVGIEKAPKFHPDVYIVQLSSQEIVGPRKHIARLVTSGTDLKYDFLRRVTAQAGVQRDDHLPTIILKLKPFLTPITRWALEQIRDHATAEGAKMIIVLVPVPIDVNVTASDFDELHIAADTIGVPVIDLRNTFKGQDLLALQVDDADIHPNVRGHQMIFEDLYNGLRAHPDAWAALVGTASGTVTKP